MDDPFISFMIWKGAILIGIAGVIAFWEGYTGKKLFRRGDDADPQKMSVSGSEQARPKQQVRKPDF